ncbi:MAG: hypothetical protein ACYCWW_09650 [Deltaproteobacteria bacterium]
MRARSTIVCLALASALAPACKNTKLTTVSGQSDTFVQSAANAVTSTFTQRPALVDILFVVDNSPSMCAKQHELEQNFTSFIQVIQTQQIDFHVGVVTTDFTSSQFQGRLVAGPSGVKVITTQTTNAAAIFTENVQAVGVTGSADSEPLLAAAVAVQDPLASGDNAGFLRTDAALAVILVTDEDDYSLTIPPQNPIEDPMPHYFTRLFGGLKGPGNDGLITVSGIIGVDPTSGQAADCNVAGAVDQNCVDDDLSANAATRILGVITGTHGVAQSICSSNFATLLANLGQLIGGLSRRFDITGAPIGQTIQSGSLTVVVTPPGGTPTTVPQDDVNGWHYDPTAQSVEFIGSYAPPPGSKVVITYATLQSSFKLSHPAAADTITVSVTPKGGAAQSVPPASKSATLGWVYDSPSQSVVFPPTNIPPLGSTIEVDYSF